VQGGMVSNPGSDYRISWIKENKYFEKRKKNLTKKSNGE
jgi:hypothetical protein